MFEIEFRSRLNKDRFYSLKKYLNENAENLGDDDKDCYYYIFSDKLLKVVNNISKNTAKLSLKLNRIGNGAVFPEIEFDFFPKDFEKVKKLVDSLDLPAKVMHGPQKRTNYLYKRCEIALKYSDAWGYHLEIEQTVAFENDQKRAEGEIRNVAEELGIHLMSEEELKKFTKEAESKA